MLSIIIPCFNEEKSVGRYSEELFPPLAALGTPFEVLAVDDGSGDGTAAALNDLSKTHPLRLLSHEENKGLGAALRTGFEAASGEWIVTLDADLTFHPSQIRELMTRQKETGADLVAGSPFLDAQGMREVPWARRFPSLMINAFYRGLFSRLLTSYTPIFRLYRSSTLKVMTLTSEGFEINAEIAARFLLAKKSVAEAPAALTVRQEGVSKLGRLRELGAHARLIAKLLSGD